MNLTSLLSFVLSIVIAFAAAAKPAKQQKEQSPKVAPPVPVASIEISLDRQELTFRQGTFKRVYPISSGKPKTPTPAGHFTITSKEDRYVLKQILAEEGVRIVMPSWMTIISTREIAIHGVHEFWAEEEEERYPASGGCIRMRKADASFIFAQVRVGTPVDITGSEQTYLANNAVFPWQQAKVKDVLVARPEGGYGFNKNPTVEMRKTLRRLWIKGRLGAFRPTPSLISKDPRWATGEFVNFPNITQMGTPADQSFEECQKRYFNLPEFRSIIDASEITLRKGW